MIIEFERSIDPDPKQDPSEVRSFQLTLQSSGRATVDLDKPVTDFLRSRDPSWKNKPSVNPGANVDGLVADLKALSHAMYIGPVRHALPGGGNQHFDLHVGDQLRSRWSNLVSGDDKPLRDRTARLLDEIGSHFGFNVFRLRISDSRATLVLDCDGRTYDLNEVGTGIAQFLVILGNLYGRSRPTWVAIDEPETGLHPRLQSLLLQQLLGAAERGVIFATHSLPLARSASQALVLQRGGDRRLTLRPFADVRSMESLVGEMGLAQFADHSLDRVVLAEGPTDAAVIRDLVGRWGCGSRVGVFSLGGSNLINGKSAAHLSEFLRVSERVMAVIDSERHSEGVQIERPRQEFERDCRAMGIRCHVLERRAMENYLADSAVKCKFGPKYRALGPYERLDEAPFSWGKEDNWRIAREMSECDWESTDVGASLKKFVEVETA